MRRGGFGALLAFTVAIVMFNGQGGSSSGSANSATSMLAGKSALSSAHKSEEGPPNDRGICQLQVGKLPSDLPCGQCNGICPADDLQGTIGAFFLRPDTPLYPACPSSTTKPGLVETLREMQNHWNVPYEFRGSLRFVIATVPDPMHTHLTLNFDRQIGATIEAAQQQGYLFARSYFPWDTSQHPESSMLPARMTAAGWQSQKEEIPGLIMFRKALPGNSCEAAKPLFVFIVGERPTGGINKQQFLYALRIMASIRAGAKEPTPVAPLLILGPNFSGSLYSLHYLLAGDPDNRPVIIHSGTASSSATIQWFQSRCRKRDVVFRSFVESDQYSLQHFLAFAVQEGYEEKEVALLTENETAYGDQRNGPISPETQDSCAPRLLSPRDSEPSHMAHFFFPRDISHLRSAYQQQIQTAAASNSGGTPRATLPLNLEDTGTDDDSVPIYSPGQTPLSEEAVLQGIVSNLQQHHSVFVVLQATNPLDTLFLSRYLRRAYPEGRIVTMGEDSLLSRGVDDPRFQGILSLTSYSLLPGMDDKMPKLNGSSVSSHTDLVFPWTFSVGAFNAMVALLYEPAPPTCFPTATSECEDLLPAAYAEYARPPLVGEKCTGCTSFAPPLWLTVIGSNGYWPLAVLDSGGDSPSGKNAPSQIHAINPAFAPGAPDETQSYEHVPHPWRMLCVLFLGVIIAYLFLRYRGSILANSKIAANFAPVDDSYCNYGLLISDVMFYAIFFFLLSPWRYAAFSFGGPKLPGYWLFHDLFPFNGPHLGNHLHVWRDARLMCDALWFFFFVLVLVSLIDFLKRGAYWLAASSFFFAAFFLWISNGQANQQPSAFLNLSFYRSVHITSGISPLVPFLILAFAGVWWAWYTLAGLVLTDKRGPLLPKASDLVPENPPEDLPPFAIRRLAQLSCESNRPLVSVARPADPDHRVILLPLLAFGLSCFVIDFSHPVRSLEGRGYDRLYALAFVGVLFVLVCDLFRLAVSWMELRGTLTALDRLTLRRGFLRLEELKMKPVWQLGGSAFSDFFPLLGREIELLRNLKKFLPDKDSFALAITDVECTVDELSVVVGSVISANDEKSGAALKQRFISVCKAAKAGPLMRLLSEPSTLLRIFQPTVGAAGNGSISQSAKSLTDFFSHSETSTILAELEKLRVALARACAEALLFLTPRWSKEIVAPLNPPEPAVPITEFRFQKTSLPQSTQIAEDFVCLFYFNFISSIFLRLRTLLMSVAGMFVFLVLSFNSYPFEPQTSCQTLMIFIFILIVSLVAFVLGQMSRDTTLSHITNTTPGQLGWEFWIRMTSFVAIPLLSLLSAQFPQIGTFLFSWAGPALNTLK